MRSCAFLTVGHIFLLLGYCCILFVTWAKGHHPTTPSFRPLSTLPNWLSLPHCKSCYPGIHPADPPYLAAAVVGSSCPFLSLTGTVWHGDGCTLLPFPHHSCFCNCGWLVCPWSLSSLCLPLCRLIDLLLVLWVRGFFFFFLMFSAKLSSCCGRGCCGS